MNRFLLILLLFISISAKSETNSFSSIRKLYYSACQNSDSSEKFYTTMIDMNCKSDPVLLCYKGVAFILESKYAFNPYTKWTNFISGKKLIEQSIKIDPQNTETRFLRFCIQSNIPDFLQYKSDIEEDKAFMLKNYKFCVDVDLKIRIKECLLDSKYCSERERKDLL